MRKLKIQRKSLIAVLLLLIAAMTVYLIIANKSLGTTRITVVSEELPAKLDGLRIVQISDLHNAEFGNGNAKLLEMIVAEKPDIILLTGDIYDERKGSFRSPLEFAVRAAEIAPTYFIAGNHEAAADDSGEFIEALKNSKITVLDNKHTYFEKNGAVITLLGIDDPSSLKTAQSSVDKAYSMLEKAAADVSGFTVLLAHRPELIETYAEFGVDLVFSGHAHGGQFRLPFIGGLYAPHQGYLPKYDSGLYTVGDTELIVSRGLGNSSFPLRIFNSPEIISVTLKCTEA